ncbi:MAG: DUF2797 domain-containing protein [Candidatus Competibacteraceae bacterium]|nr:DUF2797 domain-containing protein [Candidatus Competibacteraceae bacterium]
MQTELMNPVQYRLSLNQDIIYMNDCIGKPILITYLHQIHCIACGRKTPKSYGQGFCFKCFQHAPENAECIIHPEKCQGHLGMGRDATWEFSHHVAPHYVYLAWSGGLKVGVTRTSQIPTRWIDQGATQAILLARTPYRKLAGCIEIELKKHYSDKTNRISMLRNHVEPNLNLKEEKKRASALLPHYLKPYILPTDEITNIQFPVSQYPDQIHALSLDKQDIIESTLLGIKAQYLIFNGGHVLNLRTYSGYNIRLEY